MILHLESFSFKDPYGNNLLQDNPCVDKQDRPNVDNYSLLSICLHSLTFSIRKVKKQPQTLLLLLTPLSLHSLTGCCCYTREGVVLRPDDMKFSSLAVIVPQLIFLNILRHDYILGKLFSLVLLNINVPFWVSLILQHHKNPP